MKIPKTLFFMVLNPIPLIVHLMWWFLFAAWGIVSDDPFMEMVWPRIVQITEPPASVGNYVTAASIIFDEIIKEFTSNGGVFFFIFVILPCTIISYRESRGNLQGIAREQQAWMRWYHRQQETIAQGNTFRGITTLIGRPEGQFLFQKNTKSPTIYDSQSITFYRPFCLLVFCCYAGIRCWGSVHCWDRRDKYC